MKSIKEFLKNLFCAITVFGLILGVITWILYDNNTKYQKGLEYYNSEDYINAASMFRRCDSYKNSNELYIDCIDKMHLQNGIRVIIEDE